MQKYIKKEKIGQGTYAKVYHAFDKENNRHVALKVVELIPEEGMPSTSLREISLMKELNHKNILVLLEVIHTKTELIVVFEYMECGDLKKHLNILKEKKRTFSKNNIKHIMYQLLCAVSFFHEKHIIHRDIKPQNILINKKNEIKIADFGLARSIELSSGLFSNEVVTLWYRPPEILLGSTKYGLEIDIWSVGCIFAELCLGWPVFCGKDFKEQLNLIFNVFGSPDKETEHELLENANETTKKFFFSLRNIPQNLSVFSSMNEIEISLLLQMLSFSPSKRITAKKALLHSYFNIKNIM